jgi:SAM-dependent MidA family methyltransferase
MRRLKTRLLRRIRDQGPMTFAAFMQEALYDARDGFYASPPVGEGGHFVTSPHVSVAFADLLARQLGQVWDLLGRPQTLTVVEVGAGDGTLARQIRAAASAVPELEAAMRYRAVERTPGARAALEEAGVEVLAALEDASPITGAVVANELLDNLPFHRLRERDGRTVEVFVGIEDGDLAEVEGEPTAEALTALRRPLRPGEERPVSPEAASLIRRIGESLERGYAFLFDYAFEGEEEPGPVHAYRDHRVLEDVLADPGSRDVTAAVDLQALDEEARRAGLTPWGPISQRSALLGLGFRTWVSGVRSRQTEALIARRWREANRLYAERSRASILVDPAKLGGLRLVVLATEGLPPPAAALGDRDTGC